MNGCAPGKGLVSAQRPRRPGDLALEHQAAQRPLGGGAGRHQDVVSREGPQRRPALEGVGRGADRTRALIRPGRIRAPRGWSAADRRGRRRPVVPCRACGTSPGLSLIRWFRRLRTLRCVRGTACPARPRATVRTAQLPLGHAGRQLPLRAACRSPRSARCRARIRDLGAQGRHLEGLWRCGASSTSTWPSHLAWFTGPGPLDDGRFDELSESRLTRSSSSLTRSSSCAMTAWHSATVFGSFAIAASGDWGPAATIGLVCTRAGTCRCLPVLPAAFKRRKPHVDSHWRVAEVDRRRKQMNAGQRDLLGSRGPRCRRHRPADRHPKGHSARQAAMKQPNLGALPGYLLHVERHREPDNTACSCGCVMRPDREGFRSLRWRHRAIVVARSSRNAWRGRRIGRAPRDRQQLRAAAGSGSATGADDACR